MRLPKFYILSLLTLICIFNHIQAQYTRYTVSTAEELAQTLVGEGVELLSASMNCDPIARAKFGGSGDLGIDSGIVMTSGTTEGVFSPFTAWGAPSVDNASGTDEDLAGITTGTVYDVCVLEFDFVASGYEINFNYVFASAEYGGYSCASVNDCFGFFISGPGYSSPQNIALIPGTDIPVSVNSTTGVGDWVLTDLDCTGMGPGSPFTELYVDNTSGAYIRYGGFTTVLTATAAVQPCEVFHLKLAIGDVSDPILDSGVFIEAGSLKSAILSGSVAGGGGLSWPHSVAVRGCSPGSFTVNREGTIDIDLDVEYILAGTAVNGVDYEFLPGVVTVPAGETSVTVPIVPKVTPNIVGRRTVIPIIKNPFSCEEFIVLDTIFILDSLYLQPNIVETTICYGKSAQIDLFQHPDATVEWSHTNYLSPNPDWNHVQATPPVTTTYYVHTNIYGSGCPGKTDTITVNVQPSPNVKIELLSEGEFCVMDTVTLQATGADNFVFYDQNNNILGNEATIDVLLANLYNEFTVMGKDVNGCFNDAMIGIYAAPCCEISIPNAFSPNGDGLNDEFGVKTTGYPQEFRMDVYNRWGQRIFVSFDPNVQWDGTYGDGQPADPGVYFYYVRAKCYYDRVSEYSGDFTLIR